MGYLSTFFERRGSYTVDQPSSENESKNPAMLYDNGALFENNTNPGFVAIDIEPSTTLPHKKTVYEKIVEWSTVTNIHGTYYVFERGVKWPSNIIWALIYLFLFGVAMHLVRIQYLGWRSDPVLTTVSNTDLPIEEIEFPVITICGLGTIKETVQLAYHGQVVRYLKQKGKTVNESATADELLEEHGYDFLHDNYPGAIMSPVEMVATMTSQDPTEHIRAQIVVNGGYDDCNDADKLYDINKRDVPQVSHICDNLLYDQDYERCYEYSSKLKTQEDATEECWGKLGSLLYPFSDEQLFGIIRLIKDGRLDVLRDGQPIWVDLKRSSSDGSYKLLDGKRLENVTFQYLNLSTADINDPSQRCFVMYFSESLKMFIGKQASCKHSYPSLCFSNLQPEPDCSKANHAKHVASNSKNISHIQQLDRLLNPETRAAKSKDVARKKKRYSKAFVSLDTVSAYPSLFELLWYSQLPCFDVAGFYDRPYQRSLLKQCRWKGIDIPCSAIFKTVPTDRGMCCTFNMKAAEDIYQKSAYRTMVSKLQEADKNNSYTYSGLPDWYREASEPTSQQGVNRGLSITLDAHTDLIGSSTVSEDFQGFIATISSRNSYPLADHKSIRISPGHDTLVAMSAKDVRADLQSMSLSDRKCFYPREGDPADSVMLMHNNYSQAGCVLECRIAFAVDRMAHIGEQPCIPWYLPTMRDLPVCNPWSAVAFREMIDLIPNDQCLYCLPDCQSTSYSHHVSSAPFRRCDDRNLGISNFCTLEDNGLPDPYIFGMHVRTQFEERLPKPLPEYVSKIKSNERSYDGPNSRFKQAGLDRYDAYEKDIAVVTFFLETPTVFQYVRQPRMTWIDFLSQIGGLLGLCMGFSFTMFVELVYWGTIRLWFNVETRNQ